MFFRTPEQSGISVTNETGRWKRTYSMMVGEALHPATMSILYITPSYEILDVEILADEELREHRMFDYAKQMVTQQGIAEYMDWSEGQRKATKSDDPLFEGA